MGAPDSDATRPGTGQPLAPRRPAAIDALGLRSDGYALAAETPLVKNGKASFDRSSLTHGKLLLVIVLTTEIETEHFVFWHVFSL